MIDTSKYKGHTPGPWEWYKRRLCSMKERSCIISPNWEYDEGPYIVHKSDVDDSLIEDAPLLLEEVKRLQEENKKLRNCFNCKNQRTIGNCSFCTLTENTLYKVCDKSNLDKWEMRE